VALIRELADELLVALGIWFCSVVLLFGEGNVIVIKLKERCSKNPTGVGATDEDEERKESDEAPLHGCLKDSGWR